MPGHADYLAEYLALERGATLASLLALREVEVETGAPWPRQVMEEFIAEVSDEGFPLPTLEEVVLGHFDARRFAGGRGDVANDHLLDQIAASREFVFVATGTTEQPRWDAYAAMPNRDDETRQILENDRGFMARLLEMAAETREDPEEFVRRLEEFSSSGWKFPWSDYSDFGSASSEAWGLRGRALEKASPLMSTGSRGHSGSPAPP